MRFIPLADIYGIIKKLSIFFILIFFILGITKLHATNHIKLNEDKKPIITLSIGENWEPYYSENLPKGGVMVEIVRQSFSRAGYELELKWLPWARALNLAKQGKYHGVLGAWYTKERTEFFDYSKPFFATELVFFKRKGDFIVYDSFEDLKHYIIGVSRDSGPYEILKRKYEKNLQIGDSSNTNILKLWGKRFDILADEKLNVLYIINTIYPSLKGSFEILSPPLQVNNLHIIISRKHKDSQKIIDAFNSGLKSIQEDGTFQNILEEFKFTK